MKDSHVKDPATDARRAHPLRLHSLRLDVSFDALAADVVEIAGAKGMPEMNASCAPAPVTPDSCDTLPQLEDAPE